MDKEQVLEKVKKYSDTVRQDFDVEKIILFGSFAKGTAREDSDIDVAVVVRNMPGDWLSSSAKLFRLTRDIDINIEPIMIDEAHDKSGFLEEVERTGRVIYQRSA
jgi:predicted nucleotidyltransferase